jgi:cyclophilin family peptidyl-prolyl cis-trans isomerase
MLQALLLAAAISQSGQGYNPTGPKIQFTMANGGAFVIATDPKTSPKTVAYILDLVKRKYYDGQRVHRVENWVTQWGAGESKTEPLDVMKDGKKEPNDKVASGGWKKDISVFEPGNDIDYVRGMVGIASTGLQVAGGSQIFVLKKDAMRLYRSYAVLGKVVSGMDVIGRIQRGDRIKSARIISGEGSGAHGLRINWAPGIYAYRPRRS